MFMPTLATLAAFTPLLTRVNGQVTATGPNGPTNPSAPAFAQVGSKVDPASMSRLISLNSVNDFCVFGPPTKDNEPIGNIEEKVVAYCSQPRNGARIIPDGALKSAHYVKTPLYVQISGTWDGTAVDIAAGDYGGELDPHGATGEGNPVGGNVTSNVSGSDVFYEEWMMYVSSDAFCLRICTADDPKNNITAALQCEHELDVMGCNFVMAIPYNLPETFDECEGDAAAPPGLYPQPDGSTSTFRQRYTGTWTQDATTTGIFTVGKTVTPEAPFTYPATSACTTYSSVSNGINTADYAVNTVISEGVIIGSSNPNPSAATGSRSMTMSGSSAMTTGASSAASSGASGSMSRSGAMMTTARTTGAGAQATTAGAAASTSGGSSAAIRGSSIDGNVLAVAGMTVAGAIAGMALLL